MKAKEIIKPEIYIRFSMSRDMVKNMNLMFETDKRNRKNVYVYLCANNGELFNKINSKNIIEFGEEFYEKNVDDEYININTWNCIYPKQIENLQFNNKIFEKCTNPKAFAKIIGCKVGIKNSTYIDKEKNYYYRQGNELIKTNLEEYSKRTCSFANKEFRKIFKDFFKIGFTGKDIVLFDNEKDITDFLLYTNKGLRDTELQKKNEELLSIKLKEIKLEDFYTKNRSIPNGYKFFTSEKIEEGKSVIRFFKRQEKEEIEYARIYALPKEHIVCARTSKDKFSVITNPNTLLFEVNDNYINIEDFNSTKFNYFDLFFKEFPEKKQNTAFAMAITRDIFEKLYKSNYANICHMILSMNSKMEFEERLEKMLGECDLREKSIFKALGFNKEQLEMINKYYDYDSEHNIGLVLKVIFNEKRLNDVDIESFKKAFLSIEKIYEKCDKQKINTNCNHFSNRYYEEYDDEYDDEMEEYEYNEEYIDETYNIQNYMYVDKNEEVVRAVTILNMVEGLYSKEAMLKVIEGIAKYAGTKYNEEVNDIDTLQLYYDFLHGVKLLEVQDTIKPYFENKADIKLMHDNMQELCINFKNEIETKKFEERAATWKKWEFEDEHYIVKAPVTPANLIYEGTALHHCVGTYIGRVASGSTNILFVREKKNPDKPFFTVEILNDGTVMQIHGADNRNLSTEPKLIPFIEKWGKNKKIKFKNIDQVR